MVRLLVTILLQLISSAVGLLIASWLLPGFHIEPIGFVVSVLFFVAVSFVLEPLIIKLALQYVPALRGGIALVTTFVSLLLTSWFTDGLRIEGASTWVLAPLIVWLCVLLASVILPLFMFKKILNNRKDNQN